MQDWQIIVVAVTSIFTVIAAFFSGTFAAFRMTLMRKKGDRQSFPEDFAPFIKQFEDGRKAFLGKNYEKLSAVTKDGLTLSGFFLAPEQGATQKTAVLLHGYRGSSGDRMGDSEMFLRLGYNVFIPDLRGHGQSQGKYVGMGVLDKDDILLWLKVLKEKYGDKTFIISGVSMGGAAAAVLSGDENLPSSVKAVICDAAFTSVYDEINNILRRAPQPFRFVSIKLVEMWCRIFAKYTFKKNSPLSAVKRASVPTLFIHGERDDFVPYRFGRVLFENCRAEKLFVSVPEAGHGLSYFVAPKEVTEEIKNFLNKHVC